jgi:uncharacterized caspase-like protein
MSSTLRVQRCASRRVLLATTLLVLVAVVNITVDAEDTAPLQSRALVVGVGRYDNDTVQRLRYSVEDAEAIYGVLLNQALFRSANIVLLTDRTQLKPTRRNIMSALSATLSHAQKADLVVIYFAGYATVDRSSGASTLYLLPRDADPDSPASSGLSLEEVGKILNRAASERFLLLLDAGHSGAAIGPISREMTKRQDNVEWAIVTASRPEETSVELDDLRHGLFTYYVLHGLGGAADRDGDGVVTLPELFEYVEGQMILKSRVLGISQHPLMFGRFAGLGPAKGVFH